MIKLTYFNIALIAIILGITSCGEPVDRSKRVVNVDNPTAKSQTSADSSPVSSIETAIEEEPEVESISSKESNESETPTVAQTPTDTEQTKLSVKEYAGQILGVQNGQFTNPNWHTQLTNDYNHISSFCTDGNPNCPVPNYNMFVQSGQNLGNHLFDTFYNSNTQGLQCNMDMNNYWAGFVGAGYLNRIEILINVSVFFNGRLINQEQFVEQEYAPVLLHHLYNNFQNQFNNYINQNRCVLPPPPPVPVQRPNIPVNGGCGLNVCAPVYPPCTQPIVIEPRPIHVPPVQGGYFGNSNCGAAYGSGYGSCTPYGYGSRDGSSVHWNINIGGVHY